MTSSYKFLFSIVIPTYNRCESLARILQRLADQTRQDFEVVVSIDGASDGTASMLARLAFELPYRLRRIEGPNAGPAVARNRAAKLAEGRYLLFIDDDIEAAPDLLEQHAASHAAQPGAVVIGVTPPPPQGLSNAWSVYEANMLEKHYRKVREGYWQAAGPRLFYTGNSSVEREVFLQLGGFDVNLKRGEDIELGYRLQAAGLKFVLNERASGLHYNAPRSLGQWLTIPYRYGRLDAYLDLSKEHRGLVAGIGQEFLDRHVLTQSLVRFCLDHPWRSRLAGLSLGTLARLGTGPAARAACSALYNLRYYQGLVDELGAVEVFWANTDPTLAQFYSPTEEREGQPRPDPVPPISVVMGTRNRPDSLRTALQHLLALPYPHFEVLVLDQSDGGESEAVALSFAASPRLRYERLASRGQNRAISRGLELARHDLIALTDDDCRPHETWLHELAHIFVQRPEVGLVSGRVQACPHDLKSEYVPAFDFDKPRFIGRKALEEPGGFGMGANMALRRNLYEAIKPLDLQIGPGTQPFPAGNDLDLCYRAYKAGFIHLQSPRPWLWHDGVRVQADRRKLVEGYNVTTTALYAKYLRRGDLTALRLLWANLLASFRYSLVRLAGRQRSFGLYGLFASLRGVWRGLREPLLPPTDRFAAFRGPLAASVVEASALPPLTVSISTRNRPADLERAIRSILATDYPRYELLVIDQSDNDEGTTARLVEKLTQEYAGRNGLTIRRSASLPVGLGYSHNQAVREAAHEIVAFTDDDCRVGSDWLRRIGEAFLTRPGLGLLVGAVLAGSHDRDAGFIPSFNGFRAGPGSLWRYCQPGRAGMGANCAVTKTAFALSGPFDEALGSGSRFKSSNDIDFFYRAWRRGLTVYYDPSCRVWHDGFRSYETVGNLNARSYFGLGTSFGKYVRCKDPLAAFCLFSWFAITGGQAALYALPRLMNGRRPLGLGNLRSLSQGLRQAFKAPINRQWGVFQVEHAELRSWRDDTRPSTSTSTTAPHEQP